jgi:energy-coupling factor transporter ATP-binding protein EcfA2
MTLIKFHVENWRCVEKLDLELSHINILIGPNSSGKSSLAHAAYVLAKAPMVKDVRELLRGLYGLDVEFIARLGCSGPCYPVVLEAEGSPGRVELRVKSSTEVEVSGKLWSSAYIMPSQRIDYVRLLQLIQSVVRREELETMSGRSAISFVYSLAQMLITGFPSLPSIFLDDLMKIMGPQRAVSEVAKFKDVGSLILELIPLLSMTSYKYVDPYTNVELPATAAPDGVIDLGLIESFLSKVETESLIAVEEPENHKHPLRLVELVEFMARKAVEGRLTLVVTTHSDLILHSLAKIVEAGVIKPGDVTVYYLERGSEKPWTTAKRIHVYEDGTFDEIPHVTEVISRVF